MISLDDLMGALKAQGVSLPADEAPECIEYGDGEGDLRDALARARELRDNGHPVILKKR